MSTTTTRAAETWAHILAQPDGYPMGIASDYATDDGAEPAEACAAVEAVAQAHLDAHPDDHKARRLLGEWLQWHGDERGEGYRALAACGKEPYCGNRKRMVWFCKRMVWFCARYYDAIAATEEAAIHRMLPHHLEGDWCDAIKQRKPTSANWHDYRTRRAAEDAASLAFARLPAERRAALLRGEM